ncbi:putative RNA-directed DNA polymerase [Helianthus annuus]|nr:putative RNA-directed DNA polymerase [Helianthus annuus]
MASKTDEEGEWIIDSGCTEYITHLQNILINEKAAPFEGPVLIPNGESIPVKGKGEYVLPGGAKVKNVLYIPDFKCNLLSVSRLSRDLQCVVSFFPDFCVMQGLQRRNLIGAGRCEGGLYRMKMVQEKKALASTIETWHKRLGHASKGKLAKVDFLSAITTKLGNFCDSCAMAKFARTPFPSSFIKTIEPFQLVHCDIWGGYRVPSYTKANYFLTIVDDYSRAVWVFLIKHKSDASKCLMFFCKMVEVQFDKTIKRIRCDNGSEFTSNDMIQFYNERGMLLETTCPHTPQQNGVVERKHRHLLETARALRFGANLPKCFWGECVLTAAYVINRLPSNVLKNKTPYEIIFGTKPDYGHLRVFGCLAYFKNFNTKGDKFEQRAKPGVFLGYPPGTKGYKIFDLETRKIMVSRDVLFFEENFPFAKIHMGEVDDNVKLVKIHECLDNCQVQEPLTNCHPNQSQNIESQEVETNENVNGPDHENVNGPEVDSDLGQNVEGEAEDNGVGPDIEINNLEGENIEVGGVEPTAETRPTRTRSQPSKFKDFVVNVPPSVQHPRSSQASSVVRKPMYPISNFVSYNNFSSKQKAFLAAITKNDEPRCFREASQDSRWCEAMRSEIKALEKNGTWTLESLPQGKRAIDSKWVYKIKYKPNGEIERFKARLVAKGFTQQEGIDYHDTFAPVAKLVTMRTLLAVAVKRNWVIHQLDVNNAFLHGELEEEVYRKIPQGFTNKDETRVCRLRKSLYGLKQASRNWYHKFTNFLLSMSFK